MPPPDRLPRAVLVAHPSPDLYGSDRTLLESVSALRADGYRVVASVPKDGPLVPELVRRGADVRVLDVPVLRKALLRPAALLGLLVASARALVALLRLVRAERPALLYVNTVTIPVWLLAGRLARVPVLCHVHEAEEQVPRVLRVALTAPLLLASTVVVNSAATGRFLADTVRPVRNRIRLVYNGVPGPPDAAPLRGELTPPVRLALVGRLSPRKGSDVAIAAVRLLRERGVDAQLSLAGSVFPGYEWFEQQLREQAADLDGAVRFLGFCPEVWPVFADADIVLVPSRVEPFGNVAVEAMLAGRPVVASRVQGLAEIVSDSSIGRSVPVGDPAAVADAVAELVANWPGACVLAEHARAEAERRFGVAQYATGITEVVRSLGLP